MDAALIDEAHFAALAGALGNDLAAADRFVADFVDAWPERWDRFWSGLQRNDDVEVRAVLLSIQSSSTMLGALQLAEIARELFVDWSDFGAVHPEGVLRLHATGAAVADALTTLLRERGVTA